MDQSEIHNLFKGLQSMIETETVFGKPYQIDKVTLIPVNSLKFGVGLAERALKEKSPIVENDKNPTSLPQGLKALSGGGALSITPIAFIVIQNDQVSIQGISSGTIENIIDRFPVLLEKLKGLFEDVWQKKPTE